MSEVTALLAPETMLPDQPEVVVALADLWIDYTLLAEAARQDSTLASLDLGPLLQQQEEAGLIGALRDSVVRPDTAISDEAVPAPLRPRGSRLPGAGPPHPARAPRKFHASATRQCAQGG